MKQTIEKVWDDFEVGEKRGYYEANNHVEVTVKVTTTAEDGRTSTVKSPGSVEADLNDVNLDKVTNALAMLYKHGTKTGTSTGRSSSGGAARRSGGGGGGGGKGSGKSGEQAEFNKAVREWAGTQTRFAQLSEKGRIPNEVTAAFKEEHPDWERTYFPKTLAANGSAPADTAPADPVQDPEPAGRSDVDPSPVQAPPAGVDFDDDDEDPPLTETSDAEWGRTPAGFTGTY